MRAAAVPSRFRRLAKAPSWAATVLAIGILLSTHTMVIATFNPAPLADQWDNLVAGHGLNWAWLDAQHNEHRLLFPRLVFLLDHFLDHETNITDLALNLLLVWATFGLLALLARHGGLVREAGRAPWSLALFGAFLFSAMQHENFTWGFQVQFFGIGLLAVACVAVMVVAKPSPLSLLWVVLLESVGLYTLSSGVVIVMLMVALAIWLGRPRSHVACLTIAAALLVASYMAGYQTPIGHTDPLRSLSHLGTVALYAATELGSPIASCLFLHGSLPSTMLGTVGLLAFGTFGIKLAPRRLDDPLVENAWLAIAAFAIGVAVLTALGRSDFGLGQAMASRYATPMILFWIALIVLAAIEARRQSLRASRIVHGLAVTMILLLAANQPRFIAQAVHTAAFYEAANPALLAGVADEAILKRIYPNRAGVFDRIEGLKQERASIFAAPWSDWLGRTMPDAATLDAAPPCAGKAIEIVKIDDPSRPGWRSVGSFEASTTPSLSNRLVFVDATRSVVGYGLAGFAGKVVGAPASPGHDFWIGNFGPIDPPMVQAYRLLASGAPGCIIGPLTPGR